MSEPMTEMAKLGELPTWKPDSQPVRIRTDPRPAHRVRVEQSYVDMIRQYRREIKLHEASHANGRLGAPPPRRQSQKVPLQRLYRRAPRENL